MDIYSILSSKPHNPHYLNRYITFIQQCQLKNKDFKGYTENHHICPRAIFPLYKNFSKNPWNKATLTARQHFIAHMMLWKLYKNRSMTRAFGMMSSYYLIKKSRLYETIKLEYSLLISDQMSNTVSIKCSSGRSKRISKKEFDSLGLKGHTKGMTAAKDKNGNILFVSCDDIRFNTGEIKGNNAGTKYINDGFINKRIQKIDPIPFGWNEGRILKNSQKNSIWINNGIESKMIHKNYMIPEGFVLGRLLEEKPKGSSGKIWINNGYERKMIKNTEEIPDGWVRGIMR